MSTFVITKRKDGEFQFNLKAGNGEVILSSEGYSSKQGCTNGIESVMKNAADEKRYEQKTAGNGKYYFVLTSANGQVIGTSEMYETAAGRDGGIDAVKRNAPSATIDDQTL